MKTDLISVLRRAAPSLVEDLLGAVALVVILFAFLNLPGTI